MSAAPARHSTRTTATREKLYAAATKLVGERGIDQVTVEEIAADAGVAKGTVYYNFASKDLLIEGLLENRLRALIADLKEIEHEDGSPAISRIVDVLLGFAGANVSVVQIIVAEMWRASSRWHDVLGRMRADILDTLERVVGEAGGSHAVGARTVAVGLLATCLTVGLDWQIYAPAHERDEIEQQITLLFDA